MKPKAIYSIGDMSRICNISKKALRHYDKIGLISPLRQDNNNYRYYTTESLLAVPVIKYYKQMGFTLDEMRIFIEGRAFNVYSSIQKSFLSKIEELKKEQEEILRQYVSVKDWYELISEAEAVIVNNISEVSIKYMEPQELLGQEQDFENDLKAAIINIEFTNYVEELGNEIIGPVIIRFPSHKSRVSNEKQQIVIMQKTLAPCREDSKVKFGGCMMASCYHIGPHETIGDTYKKIHAWIRGHGYCAANNSYERYVADYWTTSDQSLFVTEVMLEVSRTPQK